MKINELISQRELNYVEEVADKLWHNLGIDIKFTKHFFDRVNDERNGKDITVDELISLFTKEYKMWGGRLSKIQGGEAMLKDLMTSINIPFALQQTGPNTKELVTKTVMRKKNFTTPTKVYPVQ